MILKKGRRVNPGWCNAGGLDRPQRYLHGRVLRTFPAKTRARPLSKAFYLFIVLRDVSPLNGLQVSALWTITPLFRPPHNLEDLVEVSARQTVC